MAAKAMRMMVSEGISLKEAWARVKGGGGSKRKRSRRAKKAFGVVIPGF